MELFAADGHDAGGCERVTGKSGMCPVLITESVRDPERNAQVVVIRDDVVLVDQQVFVGCGRRRHRNAPREMSREGVLPPEAEGQQRVILGLEPRSVTSQLQLCAAATVGMSVHNTTATAMMRAVRMMQLLGSSKATAQTAALGVRCRSGNRAVCG